MTTVLAAVPRPGHAALAAVSTAQASPSSDQKDSCSAGYTVYCLKGSSSLSDGLSGLLRGIDRSKEAMAHFRRAARSHCFGGIIRS
jgi:hypothetical protein